MATDTSSVLIVEDEPELAALYASWLEDTYAVETAVDGESALEAIDDTVDVVLLDRRMPELSGKTILTTVRDRNVDCRVAMVTAVEPDFDIVELGIDDYLVKPISKAELLELVDQLLLRSSYDEQLRKFFALASKKAVLDAEKSEAERKSSEEYARLQDRLAVLRARADETMAALLERDSYRLLCQDLEREPGDRGGD